jgi:Kef-type K+ transport system membrane component KefB
MNLALLLLLIGGVLAVRTLLPASAGLPVAADAIFASGVLIMGSHLAARVLSRARLPRITGYLLFGLLAGPFVLGLITGETLHALTRIDELALGIIAFTAGGELRVSELRPRLRPLLSITGIQSSLSYLTLFVILWATFALGDLVPGRGLVPVVAAALFAIFAVPTSPATTIAVLIETGASGQMAHTSLGVTVLKDVMSIVLFALLLMVARPLLLEGQELGIPYLVATLWDLVGSVLLGSILGGLTILYLRAVGSNLPIFTLALAFFTMELAHVSGLHSPLLMGIVIGFVVENFSDEGERFIEGIRQSSLPIFMLFFAMSGARLDVSYLVSGWGMALVFLAARSAAIIGATDLAARVVDEPRTVRRNLWTGFIAQAGVSLGFIALIRESLPVPWIDGVAAIALSAVVVNQIVGPALFKWGLTRAGEVEEEG